MSLKEDVIAGLAEAIPSTTAVSKYYELGGADTGTQNQFVIFLKPEVTDTKLGVNVSGVVDQLIAQLKEFDVTVSRARIINGAFMGKAEIMDAHYGVINRISKTGLAALSTEAQNAAIEMAGGDKARVFGAHQFMAARPSVSGDALNIMSDTIGTKKLGGGTYALALKVDGQPVAVLNPFHAAQLAHFTAERKAIVCLLCSSPRAWKDLRTDLIGATNPSKASASSFRAKLLQNKDKLGLAEVSQGMNGIHMSAGPLEGMVEVRRFFSDKGSELSYADTGFGKSLKAAGASAEQIEKLAANVTVNDGTRDVSAFDATEEMDAAPAATLLAKAKIA
jgi:hypothetical protein